MSTYQEWQIHKFFSCKASLATARRCRQLIISANFSWTNNFNVARYKITAKLLPSIIQTISVGEMARRALQAIYGKQQDGGSSKIFSGKDVNGVPMSGHEHAFFLPTDEDGDSRLDHLTVVTQTPFGSKELQALQYLTNIRGKEGFSSIGLVLTECGNMQTMRHVALISESSVWRSVTPFVPTRHYKRRGQKRDTCDREDFVEVVLKEEIVRRGRSDPKQIRRIPWCEMRDFKEKRVTVSSPIPWSQFERERVFGFGRKGDGPGGGFEIEFNDPVQGPIALGYGCHYGLGLFVPTREG